MSRPNVLLITVDHWSARCLAVAGHPVVQSPTLDQLAHNGIRYTRAYSDCPVCIPARRSLMTGQTPRTHGDRSFNEELRMPDAPTLAGSFREAGYQTYAVGKLHVYPQRARIGFDDVILNEEGRHHIHGREDDWEWYLAERGYTGKEYAAGNTNNEYLVQLWHLPDDCHPTNWAAAQMSRTIRRRDPDRPAFWYLSFVGPHPPVWPLRDYYDLYREFEIDPPVIGDWVREWEEMPAKMRRYLTGRYLREAPASQIAQIRRAFYATLTHLDHQIRVVLGTLREEGELANTWICFTADHGDMLGDHHLWAKTLFYEPSANIPMILVPPATAEGDVRRGVVDDRLTCLEDVMPTLLGGAGLSVPDSVEGMSMLGEERREFLYGEHGQGIMASRMIVEDRFKLIYYPEGNRFQLFDLKEDPRECRNLAEDKEYAEPYERLRERLASNLYGGDEKWIEKGRWVGLPAESGGIPPNLGLSSQRGLRYMG